MAIVTTSAPLPPESDNPTAAHDKKRRDIPLGIATVIAAAIAVAGTALGRVTAPSATVPSASPTAKATASSTAASAAFSFDLRSPATIAWCNVFSGAGTIPKGDALLFFDTPSGPNGQPPSTPYYSFDTAASQITHDTWEVKPVYIGLRYARNFHDEVVGVLVSNAIYSYILSVVTYKNAPWKSTALPGAPVMRLAAVTNGSGRQCVPKPS
jgi:hypothetical protein